MVTITLPPNGKVNDSLNYQPDYFQSSLYSITTYITLPLATQRRLRTAVTSQNLLPWPRGVGCYTLIITNMQKKTDSRVVCEKIDEIFIPSCIQIGNIQKILVNCQSTAHCLVLLRHSAA